MKNLFNKDISRVSNQSRQIQHKQKIVQIIAQQSDSISVPEICRLLQISAPTAIKLVSDLQKEGYLTASGKKETLNGRKPILYTLSDNSTYALGVEIVLKRITVGLVDLKLNTIYYRQKTDFILENTPACLKKTEDFIIECLSHSGIHKDQVLGMGVAINGLVNSEKGTSETYFNFMGCPLAIYFSQIFSLPVAIDNDTNCFARAEQIIGKAKYAQNAIIITLGRVMGSCLIINNKIVRGINGYAGELGHMQFGNEITTCRCKNKGCLTTSVGGGILEEKFLDHISSGHYTKIDLPEDKTKFRYDNVLNGAIQGDPLSTKLIQEMASNLGFALANIINLLNPELVIIGGKFAILNNILFDPLITAIRGKALATHLDCCKIEISELGDLGWLKGSGALIYNKFELVKG